MKPGEVWLLGGSRVVIEEVNEYWVGYYYLWGGWPAGHGRDFMEKLHREGYFVPAPPTITERLWDWIKKKWKKQQ